MAPKHRFSALSFLLVFASCYSSLVHARESKFFSKATTNQVTIHKVEESKPTVAVADSPEYAPAPAPGPAISPMSMQVENGYGLYGSESDSNMVAPQKELTNNYENEVTLTGSSNDNNMDEEMLSEEFNDESLENESSQQSNDGRFYNNDNENGYFDRYKSRVSESNGAYGRKNDEHPSGMSDTRYMEGGKYYYDIKSDDQRDGYTTSTRTSTSTSDETLDPEVYGSNNEFNTMEEYYQSQGYQNNKEEYVP